MINLFLKSDLDEALDLIFPVCFRDFLSARQRQPEIRLWAHRCSAHQGVALTFGAWPRRSSSLKAKRCQDHGTERERGAIPRKSG